MKRSDIPSGGFKAISADPAWTFTTRSDKGVGRSAQRHYACMTIDQIKALDVEGVAAKNAFLFLWTTGPHLPHAFEVMNAWGFQYAAMAFVWIKLNPNAPKLFYDSRSFHVGMGYTTRKNAEFCLLGRRGKPKRISSSVRELIISPRREHSRKPPEAFERIEQFCGGPYLDMFSRETRPGWVAFGNEAGKFDKEGDLMKIGFKRDGNKVLISTEINVPSGQGAVVYNSEIDLGNTNYAAFVASAMSEQLGDEIEKMRREFYEKGWKDARAKKRPKATWFSRWWS